MDDRPASFPTYRCGDALVDPFRFHIVLRGRVRTIEPRVMDVLVFLLERPGEVVSKEVLLENVWRDAFVGEEVVTVAIYRIRKALGDRAASPEYVETVHRRGYRLVAPVERREPPPPKPSSPRRRRAIAVAATLVAAGLLWTVTRAPSPHVEGPSERARAAYARGLYFWDRRRPEELAKAMASFREATELSPDFAPAWAGLADTLALETDLGLRPSDELATRARAFAARAMELDPTSPEAWTARGLVRLVFDLDVERAQSDVRRALHLAADEPVALQILSWLLSAQGRFAEAVAAAERASVLRPVAVSPRVDLAYMLYLSGRHEDAMRAAREALAIDERQTAAYSTLGWASVLAGRPREGYEAFRARVRNGSGDERELAALETSYEREGLRGLYRHWLASRRDAMGWTGRARLHAALGEVDEALACLERAVAARDSAVLWVAADPGFRPLSGDPRFVDLLARLRL